MKRFSVKALLGFMIVAAIGFSLLQAQLQRAKAQKAAILAIRNSGGAVQYDRESLREARCLQHVLRGYTDDFVANVIGASIVNDQQLEHLAGLNHLREIELDGPAITDAGLKHIVGLRDVVRISFHSTSVTDEGFDELRQALPNCTIEK